MEAKRYAKALVKKIKSTKDGLLMGVIGSTATVDRYGESIDQKSWILKDFKKNPVILWAHNLTMGEERPPIGKAVNLEVKAGKLVFDIQFDMKDPFAVDIFRKYNEGFLNAFSVGFIAHSRDTEKDVPVLRDNELLELSAVPVPANPEALQALRKRSFAVRSFDKLLDEAEKENKKHLKKVKSKKTKSAKKATKKAKGIVSAKKVKAKKQKRSKSVPTPTSPSPDTTRHVVAVMREASKQINEALRVYNAEVRGGNAKAKKKKGDKNK